MPLVCVPPSHHYNHMKHILTTCWDSYGIQKSRHFRRLFYFLWLVVFGDLGFDQGSWSSEKSGGSCLPSSQFFIQIILIGLHCCV